jgi:hypothetical protein
MNIQTVAENLRNTIAGKEELLALCPETEKNINIRAFLKVNIDELKRILQDVEQCELDHEALKDDLKEANGRVRQLEKQASDDSWITNPDRMGGGGWSAEELDPNRGWK